jgi:serine/threonine-protein kinase
MGFVHRDLKPENIMISVDSDGDHRARILDFGIVKTLRSDALSSHNTGHETRAGVIMGTPAYLAPEQAYARDITAATDQYSLGVVLYEMLTGRLPYHRGSEFEIMTAHCVAPFPPMPAEAGVPAALEAVVQRAMSKRPDERFASINAMSAALLAGLKPPVGRDDRTQLRVPATRLDADEQRAMAPEPKPGISAVVASVPPTINTGASDHTGRRPGRGTPAAHALVDGRRSGFGRCRRLHAHRQRCRNRRAPRKERRGRSRRCAGCGHRSSPRHGNARRDPAARCRRARRRATRRRSTPLCRG